MGGSSPVEDETFEHPRLGRFDYDFGDEAWVNRGANGLRAVLSKDQSRTIEGFARLEQGVGDLEALIAEAKAQFLVLEALVADEEGGLWLVVHEPEMADYANLWIRFDDQNRPTERRRGAVGASFDPKSARPL